MTDEIIRAAKTSRSAFLEGSEADTRHIVDVLIEERCPKLRAHPLWPVIHPPLYAALGYKKAREMADTVARMTGRESFDWLDQRLGVNLAIEHMERLPKSGRIIIAANHPTGLADGIAVWSLLKRVREDIIFFANADAIRVNPRFEDVIIPVEWVVTKRSPSKTRETLRRAAAAFEEEKCVVIFPSGRLAQRVNGALREKDWFPTVVGLARKQDATVIPLNIEAKNSWLYYLFCNLNPELRDITLFHELLNKRHSAFRMRFGKPIAPEALLGDVTEVTERLKQHVAYGLARDADLEFGA
jgi:putative hemolysin